VVVFVKTLLRLLAVVLAALLDAVEA